MTLTEKTTDELFTALKAAADDHRSALTSKVWHSPDPKEFRKYHARVGAAKKQHEAIRQELIARGEIKA